METSSVHARAHGCARTPDPEKPNHIVICNDCFHKELQDEPCDWDDPECPTPGTRHTVGSHEPCLCIQCRGLI